MGNTSSDIINEDNLMTANEKLRTSYLYNFISKKEVDEMNFNEKYFYSIKIWCDSFVNKYKDKEILERLVTIYYFLTKIDRFKKEILAVENIDNDKWMNTCARFQLTKNEQVKFQNFLNSNSSYEKFMFQMSILIRDKIHNKFRQSKDIIFITNYEDEKIIPLVGLHSTTYESYENILKTGFNPPENKIYGKVENKEWPVAMFTSPFLNFVNVYATPQNAGRQWMTQIITLTNGIIRMLRGNDSKFPIIIAIFRDEGELKAEPDSYIESFDKKNIKIIGTIHVSFKKQVLKNMEEEFNKTGRFDYSNHPNLPFDYTVEWFI